MLSRWAVLGEALEEKTSFPKSNQAYSARQQNMPQSFVEDTGKYVFKKVMINFLYPQDQGRSRGFW